MLEEHLRSGSILKAMERSMHSARHCFSGITNLQLRGKQTAPLVNKHYQNEVTMTGQNLPLKCCKPLEILAHFEIGLVLLMLKIWGLNVKRL